MYVMDHMKPGSDLHMSVVVVVVVVVVLVLLPCYAGFTWCCFCRSLLPDLRLRLLESEFPNSRVQ